MSLPGASWVRPVSQTRAEMPSWLRVPETWSALITNDNTGRYLDHFITLIIWLLIFSHQTYWPEILRSRSPPCFVASLVSWPGLLPRVGGRRHEATEVIISLPSSGGRPGLSSSFISSLGGYYILQLESVAAINEDYEVTQAAARLDYKARQLLALSK